jgi:hypothetical protein
LYWIDRNNPLGEKPTLPGNDPQFIYWETPVRAWVAAQGIFEQTETVIPTEQDNVHIPENFPKISLLGINNTKNYLPDERVFFYINNSGKYPLVKVDYFVNDKFIGSASTAPFNYSFIPNVLENIESINTLKAVGYDSVYNQNEITIPFNVSFGN